MYELKQVNCGACFVIILFIICCQRPEKLSLWSTIYKYLLYFGCFQFDPLTLCLVLRVEFHASKHGERHASYMSILTTSWEFPLFGRHKRTSLGPFFFSQYTTCFFCLVFLIPFFSHLLNWTFLFTSLLLPLSTPFPPFFSLLSALPLAPYLLFGQTGMFCKGSKSKLGVVLG